MRARVGQGPPTKAMGSGLTPLGGGGPAKPDHASYS